jgi:hypothetical protein
MLNHVHRILPGRTGQELENELNALVKEAWELGLEVASCLEVGGEVFVIFRQQPSRAPSHVTAMVVDRFGYPR